MKTLDGRDLTLTPEDLAALRLRLRGPVLLPDDPGFADSRTVWNAMIDRKPGLVVRCIGTSDVIACVHFAREHKLLLSIKCGGHNIAGLAVADGAMMLDLSLMRGVWVDHANRVAHAQGGCQLGDIDRETQLHGLAAVLGFVSLTGTAGLTLGGGFGYLTRRWGYTSDTVLGMDVVTAEGKLVRASEKENADLFWGLRGGGGNFGVVTGIDYRVYPVGPEVIGGMVAWPADQAPKVLDLYRSLSAQAPAELTLVTLMRPAPPAPWLPAEWHGKPIIGILACYSGKPEEGERIIAPIKALGGHIGDVMVRRPYAQLQSLLDATQPKGRRYYWKSEYLSGVEPALCDRFIQQAARIPSPHSAVILFQLGGALNQLPVDHSPVGNRDAQYVFNIAGSWDKAEDDQANLQWARDAWSDLKEFSTGGNYINFLTADETPERVAAALGPNAGKLAQVKRKWDPGNVFRVNRNIQP
jgi:FAD/FMN-containing dehydrogenase